MFEPFPKIARLNRDCVITEKLDGTNAQVFIVPFEERDQHSAMQDKFMAGSHDNQHFLIAAGSRNRWITPDDDNYGFAGWVKRNANELVRLGPGRHYGEWWGNGIQRGYGLKEKRFSLFNVHRWEDPANRPECVGCVPVLYRGMFSSSVVNGAITGLNILGSTAAPGFMKPEGIIVFHSAQQNLFKVTCEKDEAPKSKAIYKEAA